MPLQALETPQYTVLNALGITLEALQRWLPVVVRVWTAAWPAHGHHLEKEGLHEEQSHLGEPACPQLVGSPLDRTFGLLAAAPSAADATSWNEPPIAWEDVTAPSGFPIGVKPLPNDQLNQSREHRIVSCILELVGPPLGVLGTLTDLGPGIPWGTRRIAVPPSIVRPSQLRIPFAHSRSQIKHEARKNEVCCGIARHEVIPW